MLTLKRLQGAVSRRAFFLARRMAPGRFVGAFQGDRIYQRVMLELARHSNVTAFVETGTFLGEAAAYVAGSCPTLPVYSIEIDPGFYTRAAARLGRFSTVRVIQGASPASLTVLFESEVLGRRPLFYLDAHWGKYWPLPDEIALISRRAGPAIIVIDDFQVPGRGDFGFEVVQGRSCNFDLIRPHLGPAGRHRFVCPRYTSRDAFGLGHLETLLRGWVVIFQDLEDLFREFVTRPAIARLLEVVHAPGP